MGTGRFPGVNSQACRRGFACLIDPFDDRSDPVTPNQRFILFLILSVTALLVGYGLRRKLKSPVVFSRRLHFVTMVWIWSPAMMLSVWRLPLELQMVWLLAMQLFSVAGMAALALWVGRRIGANRQQRGVLAVAASLTNSGFTLGAYLCYSNIEPAEEALAYSMMLTIIMHVLCILLIFPLCRRYGTQTPVGGSTLHMIWVNLVDIRSLSLHLAAVGIALAAFGVPFPEVIDDWYLLDLLFIVGGLGTYLGIGLQIYLGDLFQNLRMHLSLAVIRFMVIPAGTILILLFSGITPMPVDPVLFRVMVVQSFVPSAVMTVMLPNLFGMDARLASMVWVWNTLIFVVLILPVILLLL